MNKPTIILLLAAALGIGSLIGTNFAGEKSAPSVSTATPATAPATQTPSLTGGAPVFRYVAPGDLAVEMDDFGRAKPSTVGENFIARDTEWKTETIVFELPLDGRIEYKAIMEQGDTIVFNWTSDRSDLYTDFHGHDVAFGDDFFLRYELAEGKKQSGMMVAPFSGEHGWYWENNGNTPTTITLKVAGFFEKIIIVEI